VITGNDQAKEKTCYHNHAEINITVEQYYMNSGAWPANDLSDIGANVNYFPDGLPVCPVTGSAYKLDPTLHRVMGHTNTGNHNP